jgi:hypothetical protein
MNFEKSKLMYLDNTFEFLSVRKIHL